MTDQQTKFKIYFGGKMPEISKSTNLNIIPEAKDAKKVIKNKSELDDIIKRCSDLSKNNFKLKAQTNRMKKIVESYSEKRKNVGPKLKGLSNYTSQELIKAYNHIDRDL